MKQPVQLTFTEMFAEVQFQQETAHMPSTIEEAIPFYRCGIIERHHSALMAGDNAEALRLNKEAHVLAVQLNGGEPGILADDDSPAYVLERAAAAPSGSVPLWGQRGDFIIEVAGVRVRIEMDGVFGIGAMPIPGFSAHAVDYDRPYISETGYRSFLGLHSTLDPGMPADAFATAVITEYIRRDLKGKLRLIAVEHKPKAPPEPPAP